MSPVGYSIMGALACIVLAMASAGAEARRPNVVLIYADDVGYADVGVNGATEIPTPRIDALAASGLNFTDAHSSSSTCTPSRFSLLTGTHAFRRGVRIAPPNAALLIKPGTLTLPQLFRDAGYRTGIVGKWHLGLGEPGAGPDWNGDLKPGPLEVGFDSAFILPTTNDRVPCVYVDGHRVVDADPDDLIYVGNTFDEVNKPGSTQYPDASKNPGEAFYKSVVNGIGRIGYMSGGKAALWDDYTMADVFVDKAEEFVVEESDQPFFLFFSSQDIHIPNAPHPRFQGATKLGKRGDAMVQLDATVGRILEVLEEQNLEKNTIVIFTSDNGPTHHHDSYSSTPQVARFSPKSGDGHDASGPWRGGKYEIYEGGTRVPMIIRWPTEVEPGTSPALINQIDLLASFAEFFGYDLKPDEARDSRSVLGAMTGKDRKGHSFMLEESHVVALRENQWKFIPGFNAKPAKGFTPSEDTLYDLETDPGEQVNLVSKHPDVAASLSKRLKALKISKGLRTVADPLSNSEGE